jgi:hypothetical protein
LRRSGAAEAAGGRSIAGGCWAAAGRWGEGGGEGGLTDIYPPGCYLFRRDGMSRPNGFEHLGQRASLHKPLSSASYEAYSPRWWRISTAGTASGGATHRSKRHSRQCRYLPQGVRQFSCWRPQEEGHSCPAAIDEPSIIAAKMAAFDKFETDEAKLWRSISKANPDGNDYAQQPREQGGPLKEMHPIAPQRRPFRPHFMHLFRLVLTRSRCA